MFVLLMEKEATGSAPQTSLLPHTNFWKMEGGQTLSTKNPQVKEGQGPALRTLQSHEKTWLNLYEASRTKAIDLSVFKKGGVVAPATSCSSPHLHRLSNSGTCSVCNGQRHSSAVNRISGNIPTAWLWGHLSPSLPIMVPAHGNESEP